MRISKIFRYWFLIPALIFYGIFVIYPVFWSFYISLTNWDGLSSKYDFVGLRNYIDFFKDPVSLLALINNVKIMIFELIFPIGIGLGLALFLNRNMNSMLKTVLRAMFYSPSILPLVGVALIWAWMYNPVFGVVNEILRYIGLGNLARGWLSDPKTALYAVIVTMIWQSVGLPMILFLAALQEIPQELIEAAKVDGASYFQSLRFVTLPLLREAFIIVISLTIINSLRTFDLIYNMTWGGPGRATQVLATWMYFNTFVYYKAGYGSAIAIILSILSMIVAIPYIHIMSRRSIY